MLEILEEEGSGRVSCSAAKQKRVEEVIHGQQWTVLPLFGSQDATECAVSPGPSKKQQLNDVLFFCGGPIWALDWCPAASGPQGKEASLQYLAVSSLRHFHCFLLYNLLVPMAAIEPASALDPVQMMVQYHEHPGREIVL